MLLTAIRKKAQSFDQVIAALDEARGESVHVDGVSAMRQSTVWACVKIVSEIIAQLPIDVQIKQGSKWVKSESHDIYQVLAEPNDFQNQHDLISFLEYWSELTGNGYLYKVRAGTTLKLFPIPANDMDMDVMGKFKITYTSGNEYINGQFKPKDIFHLRNFGSDGLKGLSTIGNHKQGVSLALQLEKHADSAYRNGLHSNKWIELENLPADEQKRKAIDEKLKSYSSAVNSGKIPWISGAKFHEFSSMSAVDAQYIESRKLQKQEIASIFGVPLFLLNDTEKSTTWGTGLEQISRSFIRFSLNPRLNRLSKTLNRELIEPEKRATTRFVFDTDQFTLGEFKERMEGYRAGIESGVLNPNECREIEEREPRDKGDDFRIPLNTGIEGDENETTDAPAES